MRDDDKEILYTIASGLDTPEKPSYGIQFEEASRNDSFSVATRVSKEDIGNLGGDCIFACNLSTSGKRRWR